MYSFYAWLLDMAVLLPGCEGQVADMHLVLMCADGTD